MATKDVHFHPVVVPGWRLWSRRGRLASHFYTLLIWAIYLVEVAERPIVASLLGKTVRACTWRYV